MTTNNCCSQVCKEVLTWEFSDTRLLNLAEKYGGGCQGCGNPEEMEKSGTAVLLLELEASISPRKIYFTFEFLSWSLYFQKVITVTFLLVL